MTFARSHRQSPGHRTPTVELLESREMMAGNVHVSLEGTMLVVWGDDADNSVVLTYNSTNQTYQVRGLESGGSQTTISSDSGIQPNNVVEFTGVRQVAVLLNGGNDTFEVGSAEAVDTVITKWLSIEMGDGDDEVILGRAGGAPGGSEPVATRLRTGTSVNVSLGEGDDRLEIANAQIGLFFNVFGEGGDDEVIFASEHTPVGATEPELAIVQVRRQAIISLGNDDDVLDIKHAIFHTDLRILDHAGAADIAMYNVAVRQNLTINTGEEADVVALDYVHAKSLGINTNGGVDDVDLRDCRFKRLNVNLGAARDKLLLRNIKVSLGTALDGGPQGSAYTRGPGNSLRRVWQQNLG